MHKRLRIAYSQRTKLLQTDIDACDAAIRHLKSCSICEDDTHLCPEGEKLYQGYLLANARAKLLTGDTPYVIV